MTEQSKTILERFLVRKTGKQKAAFRAWLSEELSRAGYSPDVQRHKGFFTSHNVVVGDPATADIICTAHYDTCPVLPFPNFITPRNLLFYLLYQLLICIPIFAIAYGAEAAILLLWSDCPLWLALAVVYAVLIGALAWMMVGKANKTTVNDNTSGVLTLMEIALALPEEHRSRVCFVFFDHEEVGLLGSSAFSKKYRKEMKDKLLLNFDCVSDGDFIQFFPGKKAKKSPELLEKLERSFLPKNGKEVEIVRSFGFYPSDQTHFPLGVGVCALKRRPIVGYYMDRIHTRRDTILQWENIVLLQQGVLRLVKNPADLNTP